MPFKSKHSFCSEAHGRYDRSHLRLSVGMQSDTIISVSIKIAKRSIVAELGQLQIGIRGCGRGLLDAQLECE